MVKVKKDLTGQKFGRLTVMYQAEDYISPKGKHYAQYHCICNCNKHNEVDVLAKSLQSGNTQSCGCLSVEIATQRLVDLNKKYNVYNLSGEFGIGYTTNTKKEFYFDLEDYDKIKDYSWWENDQGYIITTIHNRKHRLHRFIMNVKNGMDIDHINHKKYDNRKTNLRICTRQENSFNKSIRSTNKSGYTGVYYLNDIQKWCSRIVFNNKQIYLGCFDNINDAIKARKEAEIKYFKDYRYKES